ncbi:MAG: hypothetical protein KDD39_00765 [Bdellovibrionales bacterium]|nr:hypothetical protein [Bdellovibrionales bacterium]
MRKSLYLCLLAFCLIGTHNLHAESQDDEYLGVTDPFGDPASYEFGEDEREDKEFFHLGRFLMIGANVGMGIFTGGLGTSVAPAINFGGKLLYFFDKRLCFEIAGSYGSHLDTVIPNQSTTIQLQYDVITITGGFRYYFDTQSAPRAIAVANPYLAFGAGGYIRMLTVLSGAAASTSDTSQFGLYGGGGIEFPIYRGNIYLGLDARYHFVFWSDDGIQAQYPVIDRSGGVFIPQVTLTYNF